MLETTKQNITLQNKVNLTSAQTALSVRLAVGEISKVLYMGAEVQILNYQCGTGEITISGRCNYKLLTLSPDGVTKGTNYNADFADRIVDERITQYSNLILCAEILNNTYAVEDNSINISTLVSTDVTAIIAQEIDAVVSAEDALYKTDERIVCTKLCAEKIPLTVVEEVTTAHSVARVLLSEGVADILSAQIADDVLTVEGVCGIRLVYATDGGEIVTQTPKFDFIREVAVSNLSGSAVLTCARVTSTKIHLDIAEDGENNKLSAEITLLLQFLDGKTESIEFVTDIYSTTEKLTVTQNDANFVLPYANTTYKLDLTEQIEASCENFVGIIGEKLEITKLLPRQGALEVEGLLTFTALYTDTSTCCELPFARIIEASLPPESLVTACATVVSSLAKCDRNSLTVTATASLITNFMQKSSLKYVSAVAETGLIEHNCAFEICVAKKGDDLWTTAKNLNMTESDIINTNPNLTFPLEQDTQIVLYYRV